LPENKSIAVAWIGNFHATKAAVTPIAMSPYPAGNAKTAGRTPLASSRTNVNPTILQACAEVRIAGSNDNVNWRNFSDAPNQIENRRIGVTAAIATASPMRYESFLNQDRAEADVAKANQNYDQSG
jgi:hypothetical protein